ncbi:MarR family winged helix-turn-helix transcriptional regulator [Demequina sp. NBRC 110057]|uniref:MarR family winged helix-turn-helix transcriptional regulator n=1 Tax=Demequina sp. NBRC 110057 TaxID=1570346 RepID=UPI001F45D7BE|nr:MarR family transcriptional regulator [Demequina sp. NBRC 110057]
MSRMPDRQPDAVDAFYAAWSRERPDLDLEAFPIIGRLSRFADLVQDKLDAVFAEHDLQSWEFDVLAALRRAGEPYELTPGELDRALLISSGTTTHRVQRLEQRGYVTRRRDEADRRVVRVRLTDAGREVQASAHAAHAANETRILAGLAPGERDALLGGLMALGRELGDVAPGTAPADATGMPGPTM